MPTVPRNQNEEKAKPLRPNNERIRLVAFITCTILFGILLVDFYNQPKEIPYQDHHVNADFQQGYAATRSPKWQALAKRFIQDHPVCMAIDCQSRTDLNVHHRFSFNEHPELELNWFNLTTLCRTHHLKYGHLCTSGHPNWKCSNPELNKYLKPQFRD